VPRGADCIRSAVIIAARSLERKLVPLR
jgi:hypothetical protein